MSARDRGTQGPYLNESGDWWVPVEGATFREARREVLGCISYVVPHDGRLAYLGQVEARVTDHEVGCQCDPTCYRTVRAFHFQERPAPWIA